MNLYKVKYTFLQPSFMIIEAEDVDDVVERFNVNTQGAIDPSIKEIVRLDEVPENHIAKKDLN